MGCCCNGGIGMRLGDTPNTQVIVGCEVTSFLYQHISHDRANVFTVPKDGHYLVYLVATGGDVKRALLHDYGTEVHLAYLTQGQQVQYALGDTSTAVFPDGFRLQATKKDGSYTEPLIAFQNLGDILTSARIVDSYAGGFNYPNRLDQYAGFHVKGVVPLASDINYLNTGRVGFHYWATAVVDFPHTGVYTFGSLGDDYTHIFLDGTPVLMYSDINERAIRETAIPPTWGTAFSGGTANVQVSAGRHRLYMYNISTVCCNIHSGMFIKDADGNKIAASDEGTNWKYVRSPLNCLDPIQPETLLPQPYEPTPL